ncbi:MAG: hypothetical protein ACM3MB_07900, partial [Acidobacteriota bacterium]
SLRTWFLPHASSRHPISSNALALLALSFRPVTVDVLLPTSSPEGQHARHARRTSTTTDLVGGLCNGKTTDNVLRLASLQG